MFNAVGSGVTPNAEAISAADVVPSGLVGKIREFTVVVEVGGLTPFRARKPGTLPNQKPPRKGIGPLALNPRTFWRNLPRGFPALFVNHSLAFSQSLRCCQ